MYTLPVKELKPAQAEIFHNPLSLKILKRLSSGAAYPKQLAKELKVHEQNVYYHIRKMQKAEVIKIIRQETKQGAIINYYALTEPAFAFILQELKPASKIASYSNESEFWAPFIQNGELNSLIVVGSPDPHGPEKARSRDGYYGMDFALFLGTFLNYVPKLHVRLDTEIREENLKENLIIIGGPVVNNIAKKINPHLPIRFTDKSLFGQISGRKYFSDETGTIIKAKNPFCPTKKIILIAGKRFSGTRACMVAFIKKFPEISQGNKFNPKIHAKVIEGLDLDSDGVVDDIEIKE